MSEKGKSPSLRSRRSAVPSEPGSHHEYEHTQDDEHVGVVYQNPVRVATWALSKSCDLILISTVYVVLER